MAKKNIVLLKSDDSLQNELAAGIAADFAARYPEYELIVISEEQYRGFFSFLKKNARRLAQRTFPGLAVRLGRLSARRAEARLAKNQRVYAHFSNPAKINEGTRFGHKVIRNIVYRYKPKCVAVLDAAILAKVVAAKRRFDFNLKLVSVPTGSYFDARSLFFGVDRYAVLSREMQDAVARVRGEGSVETVRFFRYGAGPQEKSRVRDELGLENSAVFLLVPTPETRRAFARMILDIFAANGEFNVLVYCGEHNRMTRYFENFKVSKDLFRMSIAEDFERGVEAADYVLTSPNIRAINRSFAAGSLPIVYVPKSLPESRNAEFYIDHRLCAEVESADRFPYLLNRILSSIAFGAELKRNAADYLAALPEKAVADAICSAAKKLDEEQHI